MKQACARRRGLAILASVGAMTVATAAPVIATVAGEEQELEVTRQAYYTSAVSDALPDALASEFPPEIACVLVPELCSEALDPVTGVVEDTIRTVREEEPVPPVALVVPGSLPLQILLGDVRHQAALRFELPPVTDGEQLDRFVLRLPELSPTIAGDSPLFRQAVLALVASVQQGGPATDQISKVLEENALDTSWFELEVCPFTEPFEAGDSQDERGIPSVDCIYGANGVRGDDGTWEFDLTFTAQAWHDGTLPNEGVLVRPIGVKSLAFGDDDVTANAFAQLAAEPSVAMETSPEPTSTGGDATLPPAGSSSSETSPTSTSSTGTSSGGTTGGSAIFSEPFSPPAGTAASPDDPAPAPQVATPAEDAVALSPPEPPTAGPGEPVGTPSDPQAAWMLWGLVPAFVVGPWVMSRALLAEPRMGPTQREGAMSRLRQLQRIPPTA